VFVEKLTVFGFKSFNEKRSLDFGPGISGIIGPNGCGKSNIVDAIRWVLGEQSTKQLRGAKMEDVIFNGSRHEKPMSLAQVELTLNNDRGLLPTEYSTVTVGRRLYRSGISEYYINKNMCRLKDVRELFLDTGMGSHAYSVIERQMVDNILSDTTGHRRFLFEEAAGIMKYKVRKKEALQKLEATDRDLVRVNDIIAEVERQVSSLRRQVGKARRYREIMDEIRDLDLGVSQVQRREWLKSVAELDAEFTTRGRAAAEAETEVATLEAHLQELHLRVLEKERGLQQARELLAQVDDEIGQHNSRTLVLRERLQATGQKIAEAKDHTVRLADREERSRAKDVELAARLGELGKIEAEERSHLDLREAELSAAEKRVRELRETTGRSQQLVMELVEEKTRGEGETVALRERLVDLETRIEALDARRAELDQRVRDHEDAREVSGHSVDRARARMQSLTEARTLLETEEHNRQARLEIVRRDLGHHREREAAARSRLETLDGLRARYEGFTSGVRALFAGETRPPGALGTLGDVVRVPAAWVPALEPALSAAWQYVVTEDTATAMGLLERLTGEELGFAHFLPLDRVPEAPAPNGDLTWASETVETEERYRGLVRFLIGDLALAEDLESARELVRGGRARRAATRAGEYVDAVVIAGGAGGPQGAELLEREEGLQRCRGEIEEVLGRLSGLTAREEELREEGRVLAERRTEAVRAEDEAREALKALEREQSGLDLQVRHAREGLEETRVGREKLVSESGALRGRRESLTGSLAACVEKAARADADYREVSGVLSEAEAERERVLSHVNDLRVNWARLEGELRDVRAHRQRLVDELTDIGSERERTLREGEEAEERKVEIEAELRRLADRIQDLHGTRAERAEVVAEREREKTEAAAAEQQDSETIREARRRASDARQGSHQAEVRLTQLTNDLRHLEQRLCEDYELDLDALSAYEPGEIPEDAPARLTDLRDRLRRIGPVNLLAMEEYEEKSARFEFMSTQRDDLVKAKDVLERTITEINKKASGMFQETFAKVQENFQKTFGVLFQGGECSLTLVGDDPLEAEIDVVARPRGKRPQGIHQLSSGERALTAIALLFAIYLVKPSPFCILDEVDAPLDDANIDRFVAMIKEFSKRTQFIMITHNKKTMEAADCLYGVTMQSPGVSTVLSVRLDGPEGRELLEKVDLSVNEPAPVGATVEAGNGNGNGRHAVEESDEEDPLSPEGVIVN